MGKKKEKKQKDKAELEKEKEKDLEEVTKLFEDIINGEKTEENLEEFISGIDSKIKKKNSNNTVAYIFGFLVSRNIWLHLLLTLVLNYSIMFAMQGFFRLVIYDKFYIFALSILMFTIAEFIVKIIFIRFFLKVILVSMGLFLLVLQLLYIELLYYFLPGYSFESQINLLAFIFAFAIFRYFITRVAHKYVASLKKGD